MNFMNMAVNEAKEGAKSGDVPVGCVIVKNNKIISKGRNTKNSKNVAISHAEITAIMGACKKIGSWYLDDCELYVTLKPCKMCLAAIAEARIKKVYYLLESDYYNNLDKNISKIEIIKLTDSTEYKKVISTFFSKLRK